MTRGTMNLKLNVGVKDEKNNNLDFVLFNYWSAYWFKGHDYSLGSRYCFWLRRSSLRILYRLSFF